MSDPGSHIFLFEDNPINELKLKMNASSHQSHTSPLTPQSVANIGDGGIRPPQRVQDFIHNQSEYYVKAGGDLYVFIEGRSQVFLAKDKTS